MASKVLIVEDDQFMAGMLSEKLEKAGFVPVFAPDGEAALKELEKGLPDIILLDLILPGLHGFEVLVKIKKDEQTKHIPVIILSNLGSENEIKKGLQLGAEDYLIKAHVLIDDVIAKIKDVLKKDKEKNG